MELQQELPLPVRSNFSRASEDISAGAKPSLRGLRPPLSLGECPNLAIRNPVLLSHCYCFTRKLSALPAWGFKVDYPKIALWYFPDAPVNDC